MIAAKVTFHCEGRLLVTHQLPDQRPCESIFEAPENWTEYRTVEARTWADDGTLIEELPVVRLRAGDRIVVDVAAPVWLEDVTAAALSDAWFAAERARTCPPDCADCARMESRDV